MKDAVSKSARLSKPSKRLKPEWELRLYVAGPTPKSIAALENIKQICEEHISNRYEIKVIDLMQHPELAQGDQILAVPTLVRKLPAPIRRIIGNLSDTERVLLSLELISKRPDSSHAQTTARNVSLH